MGNNEVFIGQKDWIMYVSNVMNRAERGISPIVVKARGNLISKAIDVALSSQKRISHLGISDVRLSLERLTGTDCSVRDVPVIEITMTLS